MLKAPGQLIGCAAARTPVTDWLVYGELLQLIVTAWRRALLLCAARCIVGNVTLVILRFCFREFRLIEFYFRMKSETCFYINMLNYIYIYLNIFISLCNLFFSSVCVFGAIPRITFN